MTNNDEQRHEFEQHERDLIQDEINKLIRIKQRWESFRELAHNKEERENAETNVREISLELAGMFMLANRLCWAHVFNDEGLVDLI